MTIHEAIRNHRYDANITQTELAKRSGVPQRNISFWESGRGCPTVEDAMRLAIGFEMSLKLFLTDVTEIAARRKGGR